MRAVFKIEANGKDVTEHIQNNLVSLSFSDKDGVLSDEIRLKVAGEFKRPSYKDELKLWIGYEGKRLFYCGLFIVQTSERDQFFTTVTATGAEFSSSLKQKRDRAYEKLSIKEIVEMIAKRNDLKSKSDFDDLYYPYIAQTKESDLHFLRRLAKKNDAIFSIKNGTVVFLKRKNAKQRSQELPRYKIEKKECDEWRIKHSNKTLYGSCEITWHDTKTNETKSVKVGTEEPVLKYSGSFKTAALAQKRAEQLLQSANRGLKSGSITTYGREIYAGGVLELEGFGDDSGEYSIKSVEHTLDGSWKISIEIEN